MQNEAKQEVPEGFFFHAEVDEAGIKELKFRKDVVGVMGAMIMITCAITDSFDAGTRPTPGDFLRMMAASADKLMELENERTQRNDSQRTAEEVRGAQEAGGVQSDDCTLRAECDQGSVSETRH